MTIGWCSAVDELDHRLGRQDLLEIGNHPVRRGRPLESRAHEEMLGFEVDKFLVAENIIAGVEQHTGDLMNQPRLIGAIDA